MFNPRTTRRAFSLVELVIVILIIGILAAIVIPKFTGASQQARDTSVQSTLHYVRGQIELFKMQHNGTPPQITGMWTLLTSQSNTQETAAAAPTGTALGPYLRGTPVNPWNGMTAASSAVSDTNAGWFYSASPTYYEFRIRNADGTINTEY